MTIEKIKTELKDAYAVLSAISPFISSILHRLRIVVTNEIETAAVNDRNELLLSPQFWAGLTIEEKTWLLAHETLHIAMRDLQRRGDRDPVLWNIAADAVNNELLMQLGLPIERVRRMYEWGVTFDKLELEIEDRNMTKEKLYELLRGRYIIKTPRIQDLTQDLTSGGSGHGSSGSGHGSEDQMQQSGDSGDSRIVLQEGDPSLYDDSASAEEIERRIREAVRDAWMASKLAGRSPASLERAIEELLKPKVDWRRLLRQSLEWGLPKGVITTWKRPSRRLTDLPGIRHISVPRLYVLVDTSGSIGDKELAQFASEIYAAAKHSGGKVIVIPWDAEVKGKFVLKKPSDIFTKVKFTGGGGTVIAPVLEYVAPRISPRDAVVVLTDGHIFDIDNPRITSMLEELGRKAAIAVFVTTDATPQRLKTWRIIKIEEERV